MIWLACAQPSNSWLALQPKPLHRWRSINPEAVSHFPLFTHTCSLKGCFSRQEQGTVLNVQIQFSRTPTKARQPQGLFSQTVILSSPQKATCWTTFFWTLKKKSPDSKLNEGVNEWATSLKAGVALVYSRRAIERSHDKKMFPLFFNSFVVRTLSISVALFSAANLRLVFEDS